MNQEKLLELYFNKLNARPTLALVARHEAAHAVMCYLVGFPPSQLIAGEDRGACVCSGRNRDARQQVLVLLAGIACEIKYSAWLLDLRSSRTSDLERARELLAGSESSRRAEINRKPCTVGMEKALRLAMKRACSILEPFNDEIESLGALLAQTGNLSALEVRAFLRDNIPQRRRLSTQQWKLPLGLPVEN